MRNIRFICLGIVATLLAMACQGDGDGLSLDRADAPTDPRYDRLLSRLNVDIIVDVDVEAGVNLPQGCSAAGGCTPASFAQAVVLGCQLSLEATPRCAKSITGCAARACLAERRVCAAHRLLEVASSVAPSPQLINAQAETVLVPPQDAETNSELARLAYIAARSGNGIAGAELLGPPAAISCTTAATLAATNVGRTIDGITPTNGEVLANLYVEGHDVAVEAAHEMVRFSSAVADAQPSREPQTADANFVATTAPFASRAAAAHLLVGGATGLGGLGDHVATHGLFPVGHPSQEGVQAIALLRAAAVSPQAILDPTLDTDELLRPFTYGVGSSDIGVAARLSAVLADPELSGSVASTAVYARLGVSRLAFTEARSFLAAEARAFARSPTLTTPSERTTGGGMTTFPIFAGTRTPPTPPSDSDQRTVYGYRTGGTAYPSVLFPDFPPAPLPKPGGLTEPGSADVPLTSFLDASVTIGGRMLPRLTGEALETIAGHIGALREIVGPRVQACWWESGTDRRISLQIYGAPRPGDLRVVLGRDGVSCATTGYVDGAPCDLRDYTPTTFPAAPFPAVPAPPETGYPTVVTAFASLVGRPPLTGYARTTYHVNVVQRRLGLSSSNPGDFEAVAGVLISAPQPAAPAGSYSQCVTISVVPSVFDDLAAATVPSTADPSEHSEYCAGLPRAQRIPLENELTTDGDALESSWRHYLQLAAAAANEADQLGEDLIRTGLENDLRAEQAVDELERICGVSLNVTSFAELTSAPRTQPPVGGLCNPGYRGEPVGVAPPTSCVLDPIAYARAHAASSDDAARLDACLGSDVNVPWATYGRTPLCIWHYPGIVDSVCRGLNASLPCPVPADVTALVPGSTVDPCQGLALPGAIAGRDGALVAAEVITVAATLGLFVVPSDDDEPGPATSQSEFDCDSLAHLRVRSGGLAAGLRLLNSPLGDPRALRSYAQSLEWSPSAGDFSRVTLNGVVLARTGSASRGVELNAWPCGPAEAPACVHRASGDTGSLFCRHDACGATATDPMSHDARVTRAATNDLLARAVIAARLVTGASLEGLEVPFRPVVYPNTTVFDVRNAEWTIPRGTTMFQSTAVGVIGYDRANDSDASVHFANFLDWRASAERVVAAPYDCGGGGTVSIQWYVGGPQQPAVDGQGCGPGWYPMPLILRTLSGEHMDGTDTGTFVGSLWDRGGGAPGHPEQGLMFNLLAGGVQVPPIVLAELNDERLSRYFRATTDICGGDDAAQADYYNCVGAWDSRGLDYRASALGNALFIGRGGLTDADVYNGLELMCAGAQLSSPDVFAGCDQVPPIDSVQDMMSAAAYISCQRNVIRRLASTGIIRDLPARVVDRLQSSSTDVFGETGGEYGAEVTELRAAMIDLRNSEILMSNAMATIATEMRGINNTIAQSNVSRQLEDLNLGSQISDRISGCASATLAAASAGVTAGFTAAAAAVSCANNIVQLTIASQVHDLREQGLTLDEELAFIGFESRFNALMTTMSLQAVEVQSSFERIDAALTRIHNLESQGRTAAARALMLDDDGTGRHMAVDPVMRHRYSTVLARYTESHERAQRLAFIARIALEQRLGMLLSSMTDNLVTVEAPARWVDELCTIPAIDYDRVRSADLGTLGGRDGDSSPFAGPVDYSGLYLGDYVRRLEQVFESYSFAFPFREGTDTSVLSLRDDLLRIREEAIGLSPNFLLQAGHLDQLASSTRGGWMLDGCDALTDWPTEAPIPDRPSCIAPNVIDPGEEASGYQDPIAISGTDFDRPPAFRAEFGVRDLGGAPGQSLTASTRLVQWVVVPPGTYRVSWYARPTPGASTSEAIPPETAVRAVRAFGFRTSGGVEEWDEEPLVLPGTVVSSNVLAGTPPAPTLPSGWTRAHFLFRVVEPTTVGIYVSPEFGTGGVRYRTIDLTGVMLDDATAIPLGSASSSLSPGPFFDTRDTRSVLLPGGEDTDGSTFRREAFDYACTRVCADGYDGDCPDEAARQRCFYEVSLPGRLEDLPALAVGSPAGVADGNYNYRFERIGVNFVGVGLRDCSTSTGSTPSTCYASGNLSYSVLHGGPYVVWNARGQRYEAPLFAGRIEGARGVAAERYLTNPLSSADRGMIDPFTRSEFQGRPLGGGLTLRVWDDAGFQFEHLEDIQLVLTYRYWQRQR